MTVTLEVLRTGPLALVEDLGRPGLGHVGVTRSGAADRRAHRLANRLLANTDDAATIEVTLGGLSVRVRGGPLAIVVSGAHARPSASGIPFGLNSIQRIEDGQVVTLGTPVDGLRSYLAARGGIDVVPALGSRSYDTLSGIGPPPLRPGDVLPIGRADTDFPEIEHAPISPVPGGGVDLEVIPGPRDDWFVSRESLVTCDWVVSGHSNRIGLRLTGPPIQHRWPGRQLPSEGATRGAIQVPPNGQPVILGPDHPVTGGYPVIGVIADADTDAVAQLRPGQRVRMHWKSRGIAAGLVKLR